MYQSVTWNLDLSHAPTRERRVKTDADNRRCYKAGFGSSSELNQVKIVDRGFGSMETL
jgi:hypothetical protein